MSSTSTRTAEKVLAVDIKVGDEIARTKTAVLAGETWTVAAVECHPLSRRFRHENGQTMMRPSLETPIWRLKVDEMTRVEMDDPAIAQLEAEADAAHEVLERAGATAGVEGVRNYAIRHYNDGRGWDQIVEAWSDDEIREAVDAAGATTLEEAIAAVGTIVGTVADVEDDMRAAAASEREAAEGPAEQADSITAGSGTAKQLENLQRGSKRRAPSAAAASKRSSSKAAPAAGDATVREGSTLWAALEVLRTSRKPLTPAEVYDKILAKGLAPGLKGKTPVASVGARLATAHKRKAHGVTRPEPGRYAIERKGR